MSTVDRAFANRIKAGNGWLDGDSTNILGENPRCVEITQYTTAWGGEAFGLTFEGQRNKYTPSDFVRNPRVYWRAS